MKVDKAGKSYWDDVWGSTILPSAVDPRKPGLNNYVNRKFHEYFYKTFSTMNTDDKTLLEIGCAKSQWLPYLSKEFGFKVSGMDYSKVGCQQAAQILNNEKVDGAVVCADFFKPPEYMYEAYDVVISFGVVEHFENTVECIQAFRKFLKPNGIIITVIPNMTGISAILQKILNRPVYDIHVILDVHMLRDAHELSGLKILECNYFLSINFGMINLNGLDPEDMSTRIKASLLLNLSRVSKVFWKIEETLGDFPKSKLLSPYIICAAEMSV